jgi:hypothetical protein
VRRVDHQSLSDRGDLQHRADHSISGFTRIRIIYDSNTVHSSSSGMRADFPSAAFGER